MSLSAECFCGCGADGFACREADFAGSTVGVAGIDGEDAHVSVTAMQVLCAYGERRGFDAIGGEHGSGGCGCVSDDDCEVGFAARLESGFDSSEAKAERQRAVGERGSWSHV